MLVGESMNLDDGNSSTEARSRRTKTLSRERDANSRRRRRAIEALDHTINGIAKRRSRAA
jgi:hypothetical protein